jgi:hypothetical protein
MAPPLDTLETVVKPSFTDWYLRRSLSGIDERDILNWEHQGLIKLVPFTVSLNIAPNFGLDIVRAHAPIPTEYEYSGIHVSTGFGKRIETVFTSEKGRRVIEANR